MHKIYISDPLSLQYIRVNIHDSKYGKTVYYSPVHTQQDSCKPCIILYLISYMYCTINRSTLIHKTSQYRPILSHFCVPVFEELSCKTALSIDTGTFPRSSIERYVYFGHKLNCSYTFHLNVKFFLILENRRQCFKLYAHTNILYCIIIHRLNTLAIIVVYPHDKLYTYQKSTNTFAILIHYHASHITFRYRLVVHSTTYI